MFRTPSILKCNYQLALISILVYLVIITLTSGASGEQECSLELATNRSRQRNDGDTLGAICQWKLDSTTKTFYLDSCVEITKQDEPLKSPKCADLLAKEQYCFLHLEIKHFAGFTELSTLTIPPTTGNNNPEKKYNCEGDSIKVTLYLTSVDIGNVNETKLFQNYPTNHEISKLVLRQVKLYEPMKLDEFIEFQFGSEQLKKLRLIEFHDMKFENYFPQISDYFETIGVYHSLVPKVRKYTFKMDKLNLRKVEMVDVEMLDEKGFEEHSFTLAAGNCYHSGTKTLEIILRNMKLKHEVIKSSLVKDYWIDTSCSGQLILNVTVTGNEFDRIIPEPVFKELFENTLKRATSKLVFQFDPIDCCFRTNSWLFPLLFKHKNSTDGIGLHCEDLGFPATQIRNETQLNESCYQRNVFPIYMIAIVSILLLALLFGIFSFVCVYHILPSKNQEIMLKNNNNNSDFRNSSTEIPTTKASSAIEPQSTQTEGTGKSVPLMSKTISQQHKQRRESPNAKGLKSPKKLSSPPNLSKDLNKTTQRSSGQQVASQLRTTKSPTSLLRGNEKRVLKLAKVVYKLPGYKNRSAKHHQKRAKHHKDEILATKKPSVEKSPGKNQSRERSPTSPGNSKTSPASPTSSPMKPSMVVLPKGIKAPSTVLPSTTTTEKTAQATSKTQLQQLDDPTAKTAKTDSKSLGDGMSLAFKTINP